MQQPSVICETPRLILREFCGADVEALFSFLSDPAVMRFSVSGILTREVIRNKYLPSCWARYSRDGFGQWAVARKPDGLVIGECGICVQLVAGKKEHEISYRLRQDFWKQGIATEAANACRDYGFVNSKLDRLISVIEADNTASIRVAEKIGMSLEKAASFHGIFALIYAAQRPAPDAHAE